MAAVLLLLCFVMVWDAPGLDVEAGSMTRYFDERRMAVLTSSLLVTLAVMAFLWFTAHLRHVLQRAERGA
ncbi:hypothetical protein [Nonomuraea zeae]|uniref:Uncharacterized protein n=1 Tax=Nonomuraea zeae TaxID=1642303 RepID=A0A5S4GWG9_9ACTN|nr:hypothetical protein [Nonomuraea zeae]TMR37313.1 hypothetical protein ETD85_08155 [Nonomuraea zeae]